MKNIELFKNAVWVKPDTDCDTPLIRGVFSLDHPVKNSRITVCGLGFFELYLNGERVGEDYFLPLFSDYCQREIIIRGKNLGEVFGHRIYCPQYDITSKIRQGINVIGVMLAPGWYASYIDNTRFGGVSLCYRIETEYLCGLAETASDLSLKWRAGPVISCDLFRGETQDFRNYPDGWLDSDFDDSGWRSVSLSEAPDSKFYVQDCPSDRIMRRLYPKLISRTGNKCVYDAGENISGYPVLKTIGGKSETVKVKYSEELLPAGYLDESHSHDQQSMFVTDNKPRVLHPQFTFQGFRYFEVEGAAEVIDCAVIHTDIPITSSFECDNELLNWLYRTYLNTRLANMHFGIPCDCPHTERRGYTGDGQLTCEAAMMMLDARLFYKKWIADICDCQDRLSGHVQNTAPYTHCGGGPGGWGSAIVSVPYAYYKQYGDSGLLKELYPQMLRYFDYLEDHSENGLVASDKEGEWCLGDWCTPEPVEIPAPYVNTYFYIKSMQTMLDIFKIINVNIYDAELQSKINTRKKALVDTYFDSETGSFCGGVQGSDVFAVDIGLGDKRTLLNLVSRYQELGMYDTGIFGTDILTRLLFEKGYGELAFELLTSKKKYSFQKWKDLNATTLWESMNNGNGDRSHNHPMFGAVTKYLFQYLSGIRQEKYSAGYEQVIIAPQNILKLSCLCAEITTVRGTIRTEYKKDRKGIRFTIHKPPDVRARFCYGDINMELNKEITIIEEHNNGTCVI